MMTGGELLAACLVAQGVDRAFCVPGESYLALLDGLHGGAIEVINARHEGGAAMMAEADGKLTGRPGVALVTRGPGATNAASGVHVAQQDSTPMLLLVGQIARDMGGRDAFQEVDYRRLFGGMAKWVDEIGDADRIPEIVSHAFHVAMSGRPGPVVLALPEDMLADETQARPGPRVAVEGPLCAPAQAQAAMSLLARAERPLIVAGGSRWDDAAVAALQRFAEAWDLPVGVTFRRQGLFDGDHPSYAGDIGLGINPKLAELVRQADLVLLIGGRFSENPSQGFTLLDIPKPRQGLVHVHPGAEELGRIYRADLAINATPGSFLAAALEVPAGRRFTERRQAARQAYLDWTRTPPGVGAVTMAHVVLQLREAVGGDTIIANGAGNYAIWPHRFLRYRPGMQLAPTSGSMGYGLPAAIAAAKRRPQAEVFVFAGDGCFQMTSAEFAVAVEHRLRVRVLVCDNGMYGTIRMHQERDYPGRQIATALANPDFALWAKSYGAAAFTVARDADFVAALAQARAADGPALVHLKLDPRDIAPGRTL
ncbi:MAG: thiamine pyrophosphate protein [Alphaproteobacteria bacterium]|nr:MAG: thiamine pyrophosphate protein [Alphaproteobacteria bacterium]